MKLMKKITSFMPGAGSESKWFYRNTERLISAKDAKKIQKTAYENTFCSSDDSCTPVYPEIAAQLDDKNEQVVRAAVLNLYKIAENCGQYRANILDILSRRAENMSFGNEMQAYIDDKISRLKKM